MKNKQKEKSYFDDIIAPRLKVPGPEKYGEVKTWCDAAEDGGKRPKGMFLKDARITSTDRIFVQEKKHPIPSPCKYNNLEAWKSTQPKIMGTQLF